ncbi:MAG: hypothetical protein GYB36_10545 [Alphaproteobacteria bacterium]|nr:hypothetical protein [Alphaproteobacteria bacterium]
MRAFESLTRTPGTRAIKSWAHASIFAFFSATCLAGAAGAQSVLPASGPVAASSVDDTFRVLLAAEHSDYSGVILADDFRDTTTLSAVAGQVEFHPFNDEFYLAAGALQTFDDGQPEWARISDSAYVTPLPSRTLADVDNTGELQELVRYFGAGIRVHSVNEWSLTVEGGAYFSDRAEDRLQMYDQTTDRMIMLQDDLDTIDRDAVGERHARSVKPVGHLVIRRRF